MGPSRQSSDPNVLDESKCLRHSKAFHSKKESIVSICVRPRISKDFIRKRNPDESKCLRQLCL